VVNVSSTPIADGYIVFAEQKSKSNLFAAFETEGNLLFYSPAKGEFTRLDYLSSTTAQVVTTGDIFTIVYPTSFSRNKYVGGKIEQTGSVSYFDNEETTGQPFVSSFAVPYSTGIACFGLLPLADKSVIVRVDITDGVASKPVIVDKLDYVAMNVEAASSGDKILVSWVNVKNPREIGYRFFDGTSSWGNKKTIDWVGYLPYVKDGKPVLAFFEADYKKARILPLPDGDGAGALFEFKSEAPRLAAIWIEKDGAFYSDGISVGYMKRDADVLTAAGTTMPFGNARFQPDVVILVSQGILIAMLIAFGFFLASGKPVTDGGRRFLPSNLLLRASAFAIDSLLMSVVTAGLSYATFYFRGTSMQFHLLSSTDMGIIQGIAIAVMIAYGIGFESWRQATPGKMLFGLLVVGDIGHKPNFTPILVRNMMKPIDLILAPSLITPIVMIFTPYNQRLGDLLARTIVVRARRRGRGDQTPRIEKPDSPADGETHTDDDKQSFAQTSSSVSR